MTVKELIDELKKHPDSLPVVVITKGGHEMAIESIHDFTISCRVVVDAQDAIELMSKTRKEIGSAVEEIEDIAEHYDEVSNACSDILDILKDLIKNRPGVQS